MATWVVWWNLSSQLQECVYNSMQVQANSLSPSILTGLISLESGVCFVGAPSLSKTPEVLQSQGTVTCASLWYTCHTTLLPHLSLQNTSLLSEDSESGIFVILTQSYSDDKCPRLKKTLVCSKAGNYQSPNVRSDKKMLPSLRTLLSASPCTLALLLLL